jgi:hypothetical protein
MVTYQPTAPPVCVMVGLMRRPTWWINRVCLVGMQPLTDYAYVHACLKHLYPHVYTHRLHFGPRVAHWPEPTRLHRPCCRPPSPHACPCTTSHPHISHIPDIPSLLLDVERLSSVLSQASGMGHQAGLALSSPAPHYECISHPMLACRRRPLDTGVSRKAGHRYVALWSTVRAHRRHGRSLVQRPSHLDTPLAGPYKSPLRCWSRGLLLPPSSHHTAHVSPSF